MMKKDEPLICDEWKTRRLKRNVADRPFCIEMRHLGFGDPREWSKWRKYKCYRTEQQRDMALAVLLRKDFIYRSIEYRKSLDE